MQTKIPSSVKQWAQEVESALNEAVSIHDQSINTENEIDIINIYKMAPLIAAVYRDINIEKTKKEMIEISWPSVQYIHEKIPEYKNKYRRCFVHAYLDPIIYLKLMTRKKGEKIIDYLEVKGIIEAWRA